MNSKETTIFSVALGTWMAWSLIGPSVLPVGRQEIAIAILVLFKPWLGLRSWVSLLAINAISGAPSWYKTLIMTRARLEVIKLSGFLSEETIADFPKPWLATIFVCLMFVYYHLVWPYIWERAYVKAGIWRRLGK